ncbi:J domain-containing protein [Mycena chlorophos]|uniref:J domain-containing protein n=1 Tax=Mycena chlorophos TaxID=658473 RepID=A0A8H6VV96_MYCCL|nr:J domain-containing protein [Mycena chlorophos]
MLSPSLTLLLAALTSNAVGTDIQTPFISDELHTPPHPNATGNLVFNTISSLLQHWPNTRYHSGQTIVPAVIPEGTLLYHGRLDDAIPSSGEWTALDPEFSHIYCFDEPEKCWLLTLVTTRPLQVLYFDGSSATKSPDGTLDTQDLLTWGAVFPDRLNREWEYARLDALCEWGRETGFDAFLRMQLNFELMLCDFTRGVEVVSFVHLEVESMFPDHFYYSFIHTSEWHDHFPGDVRFQLDLTRVVSMYDTDLAPSLVGTRWGVERREHRVLGISPEDIVAVRNRISQPAQSGSGIDWRALFQVIKDRYGKRLQVLRHDLRDDSAQRAFRVVGNLLAPYLLRSGSPTAIYRLCSTAHTSYAASRPSLTASEGLLLKAAQETTREICRTLVNLWADGVENVSIPRWRREIDRLTAWLDWDVWLTCEPACDIDVGNMPSAWSPIFT